MEEETLLAVPIYRALNQPNLWMGGDREMSMTLILIVFVLIFFVRTWLAFFIAITLWSLVLPLIRWMTKVDAQMRFVFLKQLHHQKYYPSHSTPHAELQ